MTRTREPLEHPAEYDAQRARRGPGCPAPGGIHELVAARQAGRPGRGISGVQVDRDTEVLGALPEREGPVVELVPAGLPEQYGSHRAEFARVEGLGKGSCRVDRPVTCRHDHKPVRFPRGDDAFSYAVCTFGPYQALTSGGGWNVYLPLPGRRDRWPVIEGGQHDGAKDCVRRSGGLGPPQPVGMAISSAAATTARASGFAMSTSPGWRVAADWTSVASAGFPGCQRLLRKMQVSRPRDQRQETGTAAR